MSSCAPPRFMRLKAMHRHVVFFSLLFVRKFGISHRSLGHLPASSLCAGLHKCDHPLFLCNFFVPWSSIFFYLTLPVCVFVFQLLEGSFTSQVSHEVDGLIFQPCGVSIGPSVRQCGTICLSCSIFFLFFFLFF